MESAKTSRRLKDLLNHLEISLLSDKALSFDTWNAISVLVTPTQTPMLRAYAYSISGEVKAIEFRKFSEKNLLELQAIMHLETGKTWASCLLQVRASTMSVEWSFLTDTISSGAEVAAAIKPTFKADENWMCPLSHDILSTLHEDSPELVEEFDEGSLHCMITNALLRGLRRGIVDRTDLATFARLSFELSPNFDQHPAIDKVLTKLRGKSHNYWGDVFSLVPELVWNEVGSEAFYKVEAWFSEIPSEKQARSA